MAYEVSSCFRANLYVVWFVCDCVLVKDKFHDVLELSKTEHRVPGQQNLEQNGKRGCAKNSAHSCDSAAQLRTAITFPSELRFTISWTLWKYI